MLTWCVSRQREATRFQFIVDLLDVWVPATNLGLVNLNDGFVGIFGYVYLIIPNRVFVLTGSLTV